MAEAWIYDKGSILDENGFKVAAFVDEEDASTICNAPVNEARVADLQNKRDVLLSLLADNLTAWDGEEESVREEHEALIEETREAVDGNRKAAPRLAEQVRILREALTTIKGWDPAAAPDEPGGMSIMDAIDIATAALEATKEGA